MYILDTDILIDIQRGHTPAIASFSSLLEIPSIPGFVAMELIQDSQNKQQVRKTLQLVVAPLPVGRNATLCTFNVKHYRIIPKLSIEQPYSR
jgi:predicted nucleic acid-binding protein